jgi:hypothetical protein
MMSIGNAPCTCPALFTCEFLMETTPSRRRDSAALNKLVTDRFHASGYDSWAQDRKREWRSELADEINRRSRELQTAADWDARRVQNKLSNLHLHASSNVTPSRVARSGHRIDMIGIQNCAPSRALSALQEGILVANNATQVVCESIEELVLSDSDANDYSDNENHSPSPVCADVAADTDDGMIVSHHDSLLALSPPTVPSHCATARLVLSAALPPPHSAPLTNYMRDAQDALVTTCNHASRTFDHKGLRGTAVERALIDFIRSHCCSSLVGVASGEIVSASATATSVRRQFDCVLYDTRVPTFSPNSASSDPLCARLFFAPGVVCVLEFKTSLTSAELHTAFTAARTVPDIPYVVVAVRSQCSLSALLELAAAHAPSNVRGVFVLSTGCITVDGGGSRSLLRDEQRCTLAELVCILIELGQQRSDRLSTGLNVRQFL